MRAFFFHKLVKIFFTVFTCCALLLEGAAYGDVTQPSATIKNPFELTSSVKLSNGEFNSMETQKKLIGVILFDAFETLDVFGPVEMWGNLPDYKVVMISQSGGLVMSAQGFETNTSYSFDSAPQLDILMIPGGMGTRREVNNPALLEFLRIQDKKTEWTTAVCTGSAILAKAGILKGRHATSNKLAFDFAVNQDHSVHWKKDARWIMDGKYVTSSGVSAGTDMALGLVEKIYSRHMAEKIANETEYMWNDDPSLDPFAVMKN